ncbi:SMP-30/gluconolactonase/LRE family protein [Microbulbifer sp. A4B17]|uniref:SMP-30/gluconolactonase/LRE family protein n=1 Tax=Microbulbifer sp. A4B17 TaxID=359370 RepID=UPI0013004523|nr:SMP-30/gluconolactonase/LRE family protein [Microbulbifer sp. A4B17]
MSDLKRRVLCNDLLEPEGPVCLPDGQIYTVEMANGRHCVSRIDSHGRRHLAGYPGGRPNGLALDGDCNLWIAGGEGRRLVCMRPNGTIFNSIGGPDGQPFLWPNDLVFTEDGLLYMTDSGINPDTFVDGQKIRTDCRECKYDGRVFEIDSRTGCVLRMLDSGLRFPNGIVVDDDGFLYVSETLTGNIYRYDLNSSVPLDREIYGNVTVGSPEGFVGPDGMAFGDDGRLYCAVFGQGNITVLDHEGKVAERISTCGSRPTNIAFCEDSRGGAVVTILDVGCLEWLELSCRGKPLHRPRLLT